MITSKDIVVSELINKSLRSIINLVIMENVICVSEHVMKRKTPAITLKP